MEVGVEGDRRVRRDRSGQIDEYLRRGGGGTEGHPRSANDGRGRGGNGLAGWRGVGNRTSGGGGERFWARHGPDRAVLEKGSEPEKPAKGNQSCRGDRYRVVNDDEILNV